MQVNNNSHFPPLYTKVVEIELMNKTSDVADERNSLIQALSGWLYYNHNILTRKCFSLLSLPSPFWRVSNLPWKSRIGNSSVVLLVHHSTATIRCFLRASAHHESFYEGTYGHRRWLADGIGSTLLYEERRSIWRSLKWKWQNFFVIQNKMK